MRAQAGVRSVAVGGTRRYKQTVSESYFPNDPYFTGFSVTESPGGTATPPPPTYETGQYEETANVPGQWNLHAILLEHAFAYSLPNNGSTITNANAVGSSGVKIAIIDVGEDTTHPELTSKIAYQKCFITNPSNVQSVSNFTTDQDGHGTDVSGIAGAATNNNVGFTGAGGNSSIYAYRVEATPDDNCTTSTTSDPQCSTDTADIASAIQDAIANHVNVINISLGGGTCTNGVDQDPVEGAAIADAIAANVVVVAAAGNDGSQGLEFAGCDTGVIAAGATSLADGSRTARAAAPALRPRRSNTSHRIPTTVLPAPRRKARPRGASSRRGAIRSTIRIPTICTGSKTSGPSTPYDANFAGGCYVDYPGTGTVTDCRTLIAGTSMASPTVAGVAALVLAVNPSYQSPSKMKTLLCTTADDIGDSKEGCGRINAYRALAVALGDPETP